MNMKNLIALRKASGLTQADMADVLGVNRRQYSNIELGKSYITVDKLEILMSRYRVSSDFILGYTAVPELSGPDALDIALLTELYSALDDKGRTRVKVVAYNEIDRMKDAAS